MLLHYTFEEVYNLETTKCDVCGKEFVKRKPNSHFCSMECRLIDREANRTYLNCEYCGEKFYIPKAEYNHKLNNNQKHFYCSKKCRLEVEKHDINDIREMFSERGYDLISETYKSAKEYLEYRCKKHYDKGILKITYSNFASGFGCKYCGDEKTANAKRNDISKVKEVFLAHDMILIDGQEYKNANQKLKYICKNHPEKGVQEMAYSNACSNYCPFCSLSKGEKEIIKWLEDNQISYVSQKKFEDLIGVGGRCLPYDFFIPNANLLIEYQGKQHYEENKHFSSSNMDSKQSFEVRKEHDNRKRRYAKENGYDLLEIPYTDFKNINIILSNVITQKSSETTGSG